MDRPDVKENYDLSRLTTVKTGGRAAYFAQPSTSDEVVRLLEWADEQDVPVAVIGSGSNLLVADSGYPGLALKLRGDLARIERADGGIECGGAARLPAAAARAASWGFAGLEFGVNIPGTIGGSVKMNANAFGGQLAEVLDWVALCSAAGEERVDPAVLGFGYRESRLPDRTVVSAAGFRLRPAAPSEVKAAIAALRARRKEQQPGGIRTFGSTFRNPDGTVGGGARSAGRLLEDAGCHGLRVGNARLHPKHVNFVEVSGSVKTQEIVQLMALARRRVYERFGVALEPEVQILGEVEWPAEWSVPPDSDGDAVAA